MSLTFSNYLTAKPDGSSVGVSQNASTTLSALKSLHEQWAEMIPVGTTTVAFEYRIPGAQLAHLMKLEPQPTAHPTMLPLWQRFLCHALVSSLPDEALSEVEERLTEIHADYLVLERSAALSTSTRSAMFTAEQGRWYPRPEIALED